MRRPTWFVVALTIGALCAEIGMAKAAAFKCVDAQGAVTYQQQPCPVEDASVNGAKAAATKQIPVSQLAVGMSAAEVTRIRGQPDRVLGKGADSPEHTVQWIYSNAERRNQAVAITLKQGVVASWKELGPTTVAPRP